MIDGRLFLESKVNEYSVEVVDVSLRHFRNIWVKDMQAAGDRYFCELAMLTLFKTIELNVLSLGTRCVQNLAGAKSLFKCAIRKNCENSLFLGV